jgi:hypothetical protein
MLFKRKNNVGRMLSQQWVFGGVSRTSGKRFAMRVAFRTATVLTGEIMDTIAPGTFICSDGWPSYGNIANLRMAGVGFQMYHGHGVVNHTTNFVNPPRDEDPLWVSGFNNECLDRNFVGPNPAPHPIHGQLYPIRHHIQRSERSWLELKRTVKSTRGSTTDTYIGEWMYRNNVLGSLPDDVGLRFQRVIADLKRVYPGPNVKEIRPNRPLFRIFPTTNANVQLCECDECSQM